MERGAARLFQLNQPSECTVSFDRRFDDLVLFNQLYREYFAAPFPARTTITGCLSAALRFELECIAVADSSAV